MPRKRTVPNLKEKALGFAGTTAASVLASIAVPTTAGSINGITISITPTAAHQIAWEFTAGTCTALNIGATIQ
jgi:hypothetical protein